MAFLSRLRHFHFSLRSLAIAIGVLGVFFAWGAIEVRRAWLQHNAVLEIQRGGSVNIVDRFSPESYRFSPESSGGPAAPAGSGFRDLLSEFGRDIEDVFLCGPSISSDSLNAVTHLRNPHFFFISEAVVTQDMVNVLHMTPTIIEFGMYRCSMSDEIMRDLARTEHLMCLAIADQAISDAQADALSRMKQLQRLRLGVCSISDVGLECLVSMKQLKSLDLTGMSLSMPALNLLEGLEGLQSLKLSGVKLPDGILHLGKLLELQELSLSNMQVELCDLPPSLQELGLFIPMTSRGLDSIAALSNLKSLTILCDTLSEEDLKVLRSMPRLRRLHLMDPQSLSDKAIERLKRSLPNCEVTFERIEEGKNISAEDPDQP